MSFADDLAYFNSLDFATQTAIVAIHTADLEEEAFARVDRNGAYLEPRQRLLRIEHADEVRNVAAKELEEACQFDNDRIMAESIAKANLTDAHAIEAVRNEDLDDSDDERDDIEANGPKVEYTSEELTRLAGLHMGVEIAKDQHIADMEKSYLETCGAKPSNQTVETFRQNLSNKDCVACGESKSLFEVITAECQHIYCRTCLQSLFTSSFKDETLFPPRCCRRPFGVGKLALFLPKATIDEYEERRFEFASGDRTYCHVKTCSAFIPPRPPPQRRARCTKCEAQTCFQCKQEYHFGRCSRNREDAAVLGLANREGWRQCGRCNALVELNFGCNHMTCRCSYEFCYLCGERWKTCSCEQWDEERLLIRAEEIADRDGAMDEELRADRVREAADNLRERHQCDHDRYQWVRGRFQCEECHDHLTCFIYRCRQCEIQVCWRCPHNRL